MGCMSSLFLLRRLCHYYFVFFSFCLEGGGGFRFHNVVVRIAAGLFYIPGELHSVRMFSIYSLFSSSPSVANMSLSLLNMSLSLFSANPFLLVSISMQLIT